MAVPVYAKCVCEHCRNPISFPVEAAGAATPCPHCQETTRLLLGSPQTEPPPPTAAQIINAFGGPVERTRVSFLYQLGLVLVAVVMLLLPVVYIGLVVAVAFGVWRFGNHFAFLLTPTGYSGRLYVVKLLAYVTPLLAGTMVVFFMIKPLFARRAARSQPLALNPGAEPALYAFIAKVCETVGAPMPQRIDLDCDLNASAGFRRGLRSLFSNDLVLTIGLPLVAGLSLREFAGVVAHEFGHFTQGFGMRLSYLVRCVNFWFARVCFERDAWDVWLAELVEESQDGRLMLLAGAAQLAVGATRLVLMGLMYLGHGVSCFLMRQMEHDADSYEIKLAGSAAAENTMIKLNILGEGLKRSYKAIRSGWNTSRKLPEDFPAFFRFQYEQLPAAVRTNIADTAGLSRTGLFSTHPSDGDRIRRARLAEAPGVFHLDAPASILFSNFEIVSKQITLLHYRDDIGLNCDASNLRGMAFYSRQTPD